MATTLNLADIVFESVVDGVGIRMTLFTQGCPHRCEGCHNESTWEFKDSHILTLDEVKGNFLKNPLLDGMTFSGGEPFMQAVALAELAEWLHGGGFNVWCYSGYLIEELRVKAESDDGVKALLQWTDVLVDGKFELAKKNLMLKFRGSDNQRIIDLNKTREVDYSEIICWSK